MPGGAVSVPTAPRCSPCTIPLAKPYIPVLMAAVTVACGGGAGPAAHGESVKECEFVLPLKVTSKRQVPEGPVGAKLLKYQYQYELT